MEPIKVKDIPEEEKKWLEKEKEKDCSEAKDNGVIKKVTRRSPHDHDNPKYESRVKVNYVARLPNGTVFQERMDFEFIIGDEVVMEGIELGILQMRKEERATLTISSHYTGVDVDTLPLKEPLTVDIQLLDFWREKASWDMNVQERFDASVKRKNDGNTLYAAQKYFRAIKKYKKALDFLDNDQNFTEDDKKKAKIFRLPSHLNCAVCMVKTGQFRGAIEQTNKALEIDSTNIKALFRKGLAFASLDEWANAEENFNKVLELEPDNKDAKLEIAKMKRRKVDTEKQAKKTFGGLFNKLAKELEKEEEESGESEEDEEETKEENKAN